MIYFTPGPSQIYPTLKNHIRNALKQDILSISHRSSRFHEIVSGINENLKKLLNIPNDYQIFFLSSATECMERIVENTVGVTGFHFVNGAFSNRFFRTALELNKKSIAFVSEPGLGFNFQKVKIPKKTELIAITQNETSSGVQIFPDDIHKLSKKHRNALIAADITSSVPFVNLDFTKLDCIFFSVQKGFGLPSGLGILIVSPRAIEKAASLKNRKLNLGSYHSFPSMLKQAQKLQTVETPNVLNLYLLDKVIKDMLIEGIAKIRKETEIKADLLYGFFDSHLRLNPFVADKAIRSQTVIVINTDQPSRVVIEKLKHKGFLIGSGYGTFKDNQIRIANFPSHSILTTNNLIKSIREDLK